MSADEVWGAEREMNATETLAWRIEADPRLRSTITCLEILDTPPSWERLYAAIEWATRVVPRFRMRVVEPFAFGNPRWVVDEHFDVNDHVRHVVLSGATLDDLVAVAQEVGSAPFDRTKPPWEAVLVSGLADGTAGFVLKLHHSATDGLGGMQLLGMLHSDTPEPNPNKPQPKALAPENADRLRVTVDQGMRQLAAAPRTVLSRASRLGGIVRRTAVDPAAAGLEAAHLVRSLTRVLGTPSASGAPALAERSGKWKYSVMSMPLADLKGAGKRGGGSLNDAFLAGVLGGFRRYFEALGKPVGEMPIAIPISLRKDDHPLGGNKFAGARFAAPVGEADPVNRIKLIREFVLNARDEPAIDAINMVAPAIINLPSSLLTQLVVPLTQSNDLQASNVPGIAHPVYLAGSRITHLYPFGPLPGCAAMVTLVSHNGICCIGINSDPASITDTPLFLECLKAGFDEVIAIEGA